MTVLTTTKTWRRAPLATKRTPDLTFDELGHVRRALRFLRARHGGSEQLASALGVHPQAVALALRARRRPGVGLALRAARLAGVALEAVLSGAWPEPGACPHCGRY